MATGEAWGRRDAAGPGPRLLEPGEQVLRPARDTRKIHAMDPVAVRHGIGQVGVQLGQSAPQQGTGPPAVAASRVDEPDHDLGQAPPQAALRRRSGLPRSFEDLVCLEVQTGVKEILRCAQRLAR